MKIKIIFNLISIIFLVILQISFISGLPGMAANLNLILVILIFILGFSGLELAAWWAVGAGFLLEIFSFLPFGAYLVSLSLTIFIAKFLLNNFFTNRSLYSFLALTGLATIIYRVIIYFFVLFFAQIDLIFDSNFFIAILEQVGLNFLLTFIIYYIIYFLGRSLRPVFLIHHSK